MKVPLRFLSLKGVSGLEDLGFKVSSCGLGIQRSGHHACEQQLKPISLIRGRIPRKYSILGVSEN